MERKEELNLVLNDLIKINTDRINEYRKAFREIADFDWRTLFMSNIDESKKFGDELSEAIIKNGGVPQRSSNNAYGRIYRFWMEIKDTLTGRDRESILNECEFVEEAVQKAYQKALEHEDLTMELKKIINRQYELLHSSRVIVNRYRDMALLVDFYRV